MTKYTQTFMLRNSVIATGGIGKIMWKEQAAPPTSKAFFCPVCGDVWGRVVVSDPETGRVEHFSSITRECAAHSQASHIFLGGTFSLPWEREYQEALPLEVWQHDYRLHINLYDQQKGP